MTARTRCRPFALLTLTALLTCTLAAFADGEPRGGPDEFKHLKYRLIGPADGGRVSRACGVPGDPLTYYAATAAGGVWKTSDGGVRWKPIFDEQPISSIGSIAVAPSDPNVVYVGAGEANIRGNVAAGNGIYKSTDAGQTWTHVWKQEGQIGTIIVHPRNPDICFAAVLGHAFGPNPERGVYRTRDGGRTWQRVLYKNPDTGASDVCFDPSNPRILFAGLWQARRRPWELVSGGPGSGLYVSRDGGDTWTQLAPPAPPPAVEAARPQPEGKPNPEDAPAPPPAYVPEEEANPGEGLPPGPWGKVCVAVAASNGRRVYALIEADKGGLYRSDDGGKRWQRVNDHMAIRQRIWYFGTLTVDPTNADVVWFPQVPLLKSIDGGKTLQRVKGAHHGDFHDLWIDPRDPRRMITANDGGVDLTRDGGATWYAPPLPLGQFYHIETDSRVPYHVMGNMQDLGTASGPSNSLCADGSFLSNWHYGGGGETGFSVPDPTDPNVVYAGEYSGQITRYDHRTRQERQTGIYPFNPSGWAAADVQYRFQWTSPILISPHDPKVIYHAANVLFRSNDGGRSWRKISPDLTRDDKSKQKWSGGPITGDNTGAEYYCTIFAVAESPKQKGLLWCGSDDGLVHVSKDGGEHWDNVTANIKGMPEWGTVNCIEPSPTDAGTAYVVADAHRLDDMRPYLFVTTDYGKTWTSLTEGLPKDVYLHVVRADPARPGMLYLGTERGVSFSTDAGKSWRQLKLNLPTVAVHDLKVKEGDLVVGTNGRSIWILDDLSPLREMSKTIADADVYLFPVRAATRWHYHPELGEKLGDPGKTENPPPGAMVHYYLKEKPNGEITLEVLDDNGSLVRTLRSVIEPQPDADLGSYAEPAPPKPALSKFAGVNRVVWDLRGEGAAFLPGARVDSGQPWVGARVPPGTYTLKLKVNGKTLTQTVQVRPDPRTPATESFLAELREQDRFARQLRDDINRLVASVEQLRAVRKQLRDRNALLKDDPAAAEVVKQGKALAGKLDELEAKFHNPRAQVAYDILAQPGGAKLYSQLAWLFEMVKSGDGAPPQGEREVYAGLAKEQQELTAALKHLLSVDLAELNKLARTAQVPDIIVPNPPEAARGR